MNEFAEIVSRLASEALKIRNVYAFGTFVLLILGITLNFLGISDSSKPWLFAALLGTAIILVALLAAKPTTPPEPSELSGIRSVINSTNLPMYFTDINLVIKVCNSHFAELLNCPAASIEGKHLLNAIDIFAKRVPPSRRNAFLKDQHQLVGMTMGQFSPHSERVEYLDNRDLIGNSYAFLMRVHIHADKVTSIESGDVIGMFTVFNIEKVDDLPRTSSSRSDKKAT